MKESSDNTITCYTAGSRTESGVGSGFLTTANNLPHNRNSSFKLPGFCSDFQAEVTAIRKVTTRLPHNRPLSSKPSSKTDILCRKALDELAKHNTVHIKRIAAHVRHWIRPQNRKYDNRESRESRRTCKNWNN